MNIYFGFLKQLGSLFTLYYEASNSQERVAL